MDSAETVFPQPESFEPSGNSNLWIWEQIERTDPRYTKKMTTGAKLTSINAEYQFRRMTEVFGAAGINWGYELLDSQMVETAEMFRGNADDAVSLGMGLLHTARIKLWFKHPTTGERGEIQATGHTPYRYLATGDGTKYVTVDMEYEKKTITDAITKAMSFLGMAADVRMGEFDRPDYVESVKDHYAVERAEDAEAERIRQRNDFEVWFEARVQAMSTATSLHELELLYKPGVERVGRQGNKEQRDQYMGAKNARARELLAKSDQSRQGLKSKQDPYQGAQS
jgi:hypothetical protein